MLWVQLAIAHPKMTQIQYSSRFTSLSSWVSHPLLGIRGRIKPPMNVKTTVKTSKSIVIPGQTRPWPDVEPEKFCPYSLTSSVLVAFKLNVLRTADRVRLSGTNLSHRISSESQCVGIRSGPRTWLTSPDAVAELGCRLRSIKPAPSRTIWSTQRTAPARRELGQSIHRLELPRRRS